MGKLEQVCFLALSLATLTYGDGHKRIDVHDMFHTIVNGNLSRSIHMQMLSRSLNEPITTGSIRLTGLDAQNEFVPLSNYVDEENMETTVRYEQDFEGIPVIGDDLVLTYDANLELKNAYGSAAMLSEKEDGHPCQSDKVIISKNTAIQKAKTEDGENNGNGNTYENVQVKTAIYNGKCVYEIQFSVPELPSEMYTIIDVENGNIVLQQDILRTHLHTFNYGNSNLGDSASEIKDLMRNELGTISDATGPGGNTKMGKHEYGTSPYDFLKVTKSGHTCYMDNSDVEVIDCRSNIGNNCPHTAFSFQCPRNTQNEVNGGYSPLNDAFYYGGKSFKMFLEWAKIRFVNKITMHVHVSIPKDNNENAYFNPRSKALYFGDGATILYPLSGDVGVVAHEIGHYFTATQSDLVYAEMSGGLNEAFSDMSAIAANVYITGRTRDFVVGPDAFKAQGKALRYMKNPPQDWKSIDHASHFKSGMDPHYSSGVFNKAFYLLSTTSGWDVKKAFMTMARANIKYWSKFSNWNSYGNGVIDAACDLGLNTDDVKNALGKVGVTSKLTVGKQCRGGSNPNPNPPPPTNPGGGSCKDKRNDCAKFKWTCTSTKWHKWGADNCKKTCGKCSGATCVNHEAFGDELCDGWVKSSGNCGQYGEYCKKSCGLCGA